MTVATRKHASSLKNCKRIKKKLLLFINYQDSKTVAGKPKTNIIEIKIYSSKKTFWVFLNQGRKRVQQPKTCRGFFAHKHHHQQHAQPAAHRNTMLSGRTSSTHQKSLLVLLQSRISTQVMTAVPSTAFSSHQKLELVLRIKATKCLQAQRTTHGLC